MDDHEEMQTYLDDLNIVLYRTEKKFEDIERQLQELEKKKGDANLDIPKGELENILDLMSHIYVGFIITSEIDISDFIKNAESMVSKYQRFSLTNNKNSEILFGDIKVNLDYSKPSL